MLAQNHGSNHPHSTHRNSNFIRPTRENNSCKLHARIPFQPVRLSRLFYCSTLHTGRIEISLPSQFPPTCRTLRSFWFSLSIPAMYPPTFTWCPHSKVLWNHSFFHSSSSLLGTVTVNCTLPSLVRCVTATSAFFHVYFPFTNLRQYSLSP